ncbi:hypothetical protein [Flavilitoribacter nigricans]|uniref:Uncharacterized protein n=1 Tax=Flavilitoribacter nigricans (strain ATCC 23147 / DSM 23189 / NBRC 102662 / NCIMB 1420 / SS-2) TaxID=1122177 RepID=A0A2D0N9X6_FLAN2|nr:hypothetical protein [Flavilitoribacter nigricans]PHN05322.1 hypothetical protein CRP01_17555 [Flavilitoribacter nigricans DSM 23189 = NBRC 102662]
MSTLEVIIGLVFVFLLLSLLATILQELISGLLSLRGRVLLRAMIQFLELDQLGKKDVPARETGKINSFSLATYVQEREQTKKVSRYIRLHSRAYHKYISHNLGIRRLPSYLTSEQVLTIIQDISDQDLNAPQRQTLHPIIQMVPDRLLKWTYLIWQFFQTDDPKSSRPTTERGVIEGEKDLDPESFSAEKAPSTHPVIKKKLQRDKLLANLSDPELQANLTTILQPTLSEIKSTPKERLILQPVVSAKEQQKAKVEFKQKYDDMMARVTGWYKRRVQFVLLVIGMILAIGMDADAIRIYDYLQANPSERIAVVEQANTFLENYTSAESFTGIIPKDSNRLDSLADRAAKLLETEFRPLDGFLGWKCREKTSSRRLTEIRQATEAGEAGISHSRTEIECGEFTVTLAAISNEITARRMVGWIITALAISLGANFWFDLLKLLINIRNAGKKPKNEKEQKTNRASITEDELANSVG